MKLILLLTSLSVVTGEVPEASENGRSITYSNYKQKSFFFLPPIIPLNSFKRRKQHTTTTKQPCIGDCGLQGFCSSKSDCTSTGGTASGLCTDSTVCCINYVKCGTETSSELSYFVNPEHPQAYKGGSQCLLKVKKTDSRICQLRIEFKEFSLAQPNQEGKCVNDFFSVSDCTMNKICGENKGQHVYVDFGEGKDTLVLSVDTNGAEKVLRMWNMEIKQIPCESSLLAPSGCLMYFTGTSGTVSSFNYGELKLQESRRNRQIRGINYGICVKSKQEYCAIEWNADKDPYSFTVSGNSSSIETQGGVEYRGEFCRSNFIVVANPFRNGSSVNTDRFCGSSLAPFTTSAKPFVLYVVVGQNIAQDVDEGNRGFKLNFRQLPCSN
ncbi:uncharacterized protein LOC135847155 [Planococcus citri]|uniref:uncharacterized protein LOC135847155 n=1 Tax=Planococcus citri TaxID=170843 RepID=UPI0031F92DA9